MATFPFVEGLDEVEQRCDRLGPRSVATAKHALVFQYVEQALRGRVVLAGPGSLSLPASNVLTQLRSVCSPMLSSRATVPMPWLSFDPFMVCSLNAAENSIFGVFNFSFPSTSQGRYASSHGRRNFGGSS